MTTVNLRELEQTRADLEAARAAQHAAIIRAHSEGASLRSIADACGVSHETVRTVIRLAAEADA